MSRPDSRRRFTLRLAIVAVGLVAALPAAASNHVDTSGPSKIVIKVPIDLVGGEDSVARAWGKAIKRYWNDGPGLGYWKFCGRSVVFEPDIQPIAAGQTGRPDAHKIRMKLVGDGVDFISNVRYGGTFDTHTTATGVWGSNEDNAVIAHEFGHLIGLADEYTWTPYTDTNNNGHWDPGEPLNDDLNHNGVRDPDEPTEPMPGFEDSLMAQHDGKVTQRLIDEAMQANGVRDCKKVWVGTLHIVTRVVTPLGACVGSWDADLTLHIRVKTMTGVGHVTRAPVNSCGKSTFARVGQRFPVSGKLKSSSMLFALSQIRGKLQRTGNSAAGPVEAQAPITDGTIYWNGTVNVHCQNC